MTTCMHCGVGIHRKGNEWRHDGTGFWHCMNTHAEPSTGIAKPGAETVKKRQSKKPA